MNQVAHAKQETNAVSSDNSMLGRFVTPFPVVLPVSERWPLQGSGGVQTFVRMLAKVGPDFGLELHILGVGEDELHTESLHFVPLLSHAESEWQFARGLRRALNRDQVTLPSGGVILANAEHYVWALRKSPLPIVLMAHGVVSESLRSRKGFLYTALFKRFVEAPAVKWAERIVAVNDGVRQYYASRYPLSSSGKLVNLNMGVDIGEIDRLRQSTPAMPLPEPSGPPTLLFVGRLSPEKNVGLFIESCDVLAQGGVSFSAVVVGDGPETSHVVKAAKTRPWLRWIRTLPHGQVLDFMQRSTVLAICSVYEGLPTVLLEAIASGLPVVSTDVGRSRELLHPPTGAIAEASSQAFSRALFEMMSGDRRAVQRASESLRGQIDVRYTVQALSKILRDARRELTN